MGRHGHVQIRHAEYGEVYFTGCGQCAAADWLEEKGINICTKEDCGVQYADSWEIEIPYKKVPKKMSETGYAPDYGKIQRVIDMLRKHPDSFDKSLSPDCQGEKYSEDLANLLEEGLKAAKKHGYSWIVIDWY